MPAATTPPNPHPVVLVPGARFFVRRITLAPDAPAEPQIELALETLSPFPLEQLFYGSVIDRASRHALVFAAYRRNFSADEQAAWDHAQIVVPDFLLWAFSQRQIRPGAQLRHTEHGSELVAWDEASELPALVLARETQAAAETIDSTPLLLELQRRTNLAAEAVTLVEAPLQIVGLDRDGLTLNAGKPHTALIARAALTRADIRDKAELTMRRRDERRATLLWRLFAAAAAALVLCVLVELSLVGGRALLGTQRRANTARAETVRGIEAAQLLATKLEKLTSQQLRPFEMLAVINAPRPRSITFQRVGTSGPLTLQIEAQTAEANDLRVYEDALRKLGAIANVSLRDPRMRSGQTTFQLEVTFKPGWHSQGGGP